MRGDQLDRQGRGIPAIEASTNGLTVAEIANREETGIRILYRDLEAYHARAKAQSAPKKRFILAFLDIFLLSSHPFGKAIKEFLTKPHLRSWRFGVRRLCDFKRHSCSFAKNRRFTNRRRNNGGSKREGEDPEIFDFCQ
ncbi:MAG: hypothetical protein HXY45_20155 [Syntrophaceae bacterium]|nr:hypothetical protein [Syntrophaceae bacterium]